MRLASVCAVLLFGASSAAAYQSASTVRISVSSVGSQSDGFSEYPVLSGDARFVTFTSEATNLVAGDTNGKEDIFVHDRMNGSTTRVSVGAGGAQADDESEWSSISFDGRYVSFTSEATNLVPGDTNSAADVFVHDRETGVTTRVSVSSAGVQSNGESFAGVAAMSADGRYVAFDSHADNLVANDVNGVADVFVHDRGTGQTIRASVDSAGNAGNGDARFAAMAPGGTCVVFDTLSTNLVAGDTNGVGDVFVRELSTGVTTRVSVDSAGTQASERSEWGYLSADGRYVAFASTASDLVMPHDVGFSLDVFVHDRVTGETTQCSVDSAGNRANGKSYDPALSHDGRYVSFSSFADNLVGGDTNGQYDVFLHDRITGQTMRVNVTDGGEQALFPMTEVFTSPYYSISADARVITFESWATNLVMGDTNDTCDIFVRDRVLQNVSTFCFGDGSTAPCPCSNTGDAGHGCANSVFASGGILRGFGAPSLAADSFSLQAQDLSGNTCVFFQASAQTPPTIVDDGLGCGGGSLIRLGTKSVAAAAATYPQAGDLAVSIKGMVGALGGTRYYQASYRNADMSFCPPATTNRTNGLIVTWFP